ncbi:phage tail tape measure protein [Pseudogemmobacter sp. W21_MBD1_M6]|uniref:phage tail tape measure protein n=1 Tax=Pseudogemmobacter sp. W21_MBD1_M6 TaxID=3240271 RepID=UPI003F9C3ACB
MSSVDGMDGLDDQIASLEVSLGGAQTVAAAFNGELGRLHDGFGAANREVEALSRGISRGLRGAFDGLVFDGMKLSDALGKVAQSMSNTMYNIAMKPVTNHFGGMLADGVSGLFQGLLPFEKGGSFSQGRVMPFAKGGVVGGPTTFPMRGGMGLMGEAGPEAIMPLARGADGRLGVKTDGARAVTVVMNITTPDAQGFQRSQGQIAAQMSRALGRGQRNR